MSQIFSGIFIFTTALVSFAFSEVFTGEELNQPFTIHGRLRAYNGNPSLRIWIIDSNRILGVRDEEGSIPLDLLKLMSEGKGFFYRDIYADFTVEPLQADKKGHMRPVRVLKAENIVVTEEGVVILDENQNHSVFTTP